MATFRKTLTLATLALSVLTPLTACSSPDSVPSSPSSSSAPGHPDAAGPSSTSGSADSAPLAVIAPADLCPKLQTNAVTALAEALHVSEVVVESGGQGGGATMCRFHATQLTGIYPTVGAGGIVLTTDTVQSVIASNQKGLQPKVHDPQVTPVAGLPGAQVVSGVDDGKVTRGFGVVAVQGGLIDLTVSGANVTADTIGAVLKVFYDNAKR